MTHSMLTTIDNPFDPFTEFDEWFVYDETHGHHSCQLLAYYLNNDSSIELPESFRIKETEEAINRIMESDPLGIYVKVQKDVEPKYAKGPRL